MVLGYFIYLFLRDPFDNYIRKCLFEKNDQSNYDVIVNDLSLIKKMFDLTFSSLISVLLLKADYAVVMTILFVITILFTLLIKKINKVI